MGQSQQHSATMDDDDDNRSGGGDINNENNSNTSSARSSRTLLDRSKVRILLCDSDANSSQQALQLLCNCSYQVISVSTARQVIGVLNSHGPDIDIILTEVDLPIAKGLKMLKYITRDKELRRIPIIIMSAKDEVSVVVKCLRLGAADYLVKPLRTNELLNLWTHMWRRRRMLGLTEKDVLNCDTNLVASDPSDGNTNSTTLLSDDTDGKSQRTMAPEASVSNHHEVECTTSVVEPALEKLTENQPNITDDSEAGFFSCPKKSKLAIGESSAFFTYVKSSTSRGVSDQVGLMDMKMDSSESLSYAQDISSSCKLVGNSEGQNKGTCEIHDYGNGLVNGMEGSGINAFPVSSEVLAQWQNHTEQPYTLSHPGNEGHFVFSGASLPFHLPFHLSGMVKQNMLPSTVQMYQGNMPSQHLDNSVLLEYNIPPGGSHVPVIPSFPYYPVGVDLQTGHMQAQCLWTSLSRSSPAEVKSGQVGRREAALIKFRKKRKERCFGKKIRYVNRKQHAERRPRFRGQFVRQVNGVDVDLNGHAAAIDDSDEDGEENEDDEHANRDLGFCSCSERDASES